ncbi:SRPBCC family protein [Fictibacillus terranigra]|uniref:SRPBCC family protein n=1 Tax=Fictibacillus terranigra TaxID=3058424 RepID=A0ABT8EB69_9BACL|nr:SRPBCC family protein [Fictibacillus sp. CENA-BCM004]MDN4075158.1 SRPBCC family protein [Fictibacillus sp. CENA-BCM004]
MSGRSVSHDTFIIDRYYDVTPSRVYTAWADPDEKALWFPIGEEFDFRVGGREYSQGIAPDGHQYTYDAIYQEIVPSERIIYSYAMDLDKTRISVSVASVEFKAKGSGTQLLLTEQGAFLDGLDNVSQREHGTKILLDKLGETLLPASSKKYIKK